MTSQKQSPSSHTGPPYPHDPSRPLLCQLTPLPSPWIDSVNPRLSSLYVQSKLPSLVPSPKLISRTTFINTRCSARYSGNMPIISVAQQAEVGGM